MYEYLHISVPSPYNTHTQTSVSQNKKNIYLTMFSENIKILKLYNLIKYPKLFYIALFSLHLTCHLVVGSPVEVIRKGNNKFQCRGIKMQFPWFEVYMNWNDDSFV